MSLKESTLFLNSGPIPGGWNNKRERVQLQEEEPGFFANAKNPEHGRVRFSKMERSDLSVFLQPSISDLNEGDVFYGIVTEVWYHHGIKVDIGFEYDG